jgi:hypothetical protein
MELLNPMWAYWLSLASGVPAPPVAAGQDRGHGGGRPPATRRLQTDPHDRALHRTGRMPSWSPSPVGRLNELASTSLTATSRDGGAS